MWNVAWDSCSLEFLIMVCVCPCLWWALSPAHPLSSDSRTQHLLHRVETLQNLSWQSRGSS